MSKIARLALSSAALITLAALVYRAYAPPAALLAQTAPTTVVMEDTVTVSISRYEPIRSLFELLNDQDVRLLAKEVQGFYSGKNHGEVTPDLLAQALLRSPAVGTIPG